MSEIIHRTDGLLYACQPSYGNGKPGSSKAFWSQSIDPNGPYAPLMSAFDNFGCSLLANTFNAHWCNALNEKCDTDGKPVTRFAMLHDDVLPEKFWLSKLLEELDRTGADVVAAVVPIKDSRGLTSTAIDDPNDEWSVLRRLTMPEIMALPETFSADDCGYPLNYLLVNTGCWVADMTKPWRTKVHFNIKDRIIFHTEDGRILPHYAVGVRFNKRTRQEEVFEIDNAKTLTGKWCAQAMPEDWGFSRQLGRLECKVLATRKVRIIHPGDVPYNNYGDWGTWPGDCQYGKKFLTPIGSDIPMVEGYLTDKEGRFLADLARDKNVLEIGSWCGLSTVWMGRTAKRVFCVDTFDGKSMPKPRNTFQEWKRNVERFGLTNVSGHVGKCKELRREDGFVEPFDLVFIDGSHDYQSVKEDFDACQRLLGTDALIAFHDYTDESHPDVKKFVQEKLQYGEFNKVATCDSIIVIKASGVTLNGVTNGQATERHAVTA